MTKQIPPKDDARPTRKSRLNHPQIQAALRLVIAKTGKETGCYRGIVSERSFMRWKRANKKQWQEILNSGLEEFRIRIELTNPAIISEATQQALSKIRSGECHLSEIVRFVEFVMAVREKET